MTPRERAEKIAILIGREVAELPDRTSPPDEPTLLLVTEQELREILEPHLERAITDHIASLAAERDEEAMAEEFARLIDPRAWYIPLGETGYEHLQVSLRAGERCARHVLALQAAAVTKAREDAAIECDKSAKICDEENKPEAALYFRLTASRIRALQAPHEDKP